VSVLAGFPVLSTFSLRVTAFKIQLQRRSSSLLKESAQEPSGKLIFTQLTKARPEKHREYNFKLLKGARHGPSR